MPGRTFTTWPKAWRTTETKVIRVPSHLAARLIELAHQIEDGADVQIIPAPDLFTQAPKATKKPRTVKNPKKSTNSKSAKKPAPPKKRKPVTG